ncbi:single-stranded DNA-binding protein [Wohlfahrtiimonas chitiniclastica]|uniref:single-stranded DNA-binding protein n=1 Tax=Wohlfahrtiimonas chitiniclastica TaxID=400946 RepID=UPI000B9988F0|nr:single-stranded DNA-binding protein [Wohlfahrtiimonas chitiniclastica]OYQ90474.1 single-stranded DNA-binding protein [Wohlfahrtiimonas chitiniclastica]
MTFGINQVILVGQLLNAPEIKMLTTGRQMVTFMLAIEMEKHVEKHVVKIYGHLTEQATALAQGTWIYLEGHLQTHTSKDLTGQTHEHLEIIVGQKGVLQVLDE